MDRRGPVAQVESRHCESAARTDRDDVEDVAPGTTYERRETVRVHLAERHVDTDADTGVEATESARCRWTFATPDGSCRSSWSPEAPDAWN